MIVYPPVHVSRHPHPVPPELFHRLQQASVHLPCPLHESKQTTRRIPLSSGRACFFLPAATLGTCPAQLCISLTTPAPLPTPQCPSPNFPPSPNSHESVDTPLPSADSFSSPSSTSPTPSPAPAASDSPQGSEGRGGSEGSEGGEGARQVSEKGPGGRSQSRVQSITLSLECIAATLRDVVVEILLRDVEALLDRYLMDVRKSFSRMYWDEDVDFES
mmetsp:Transcript_24605/g.53212  ORF Transcript_24605/g.53212 Transcript_24605/m.53212 type:complete len:217 (+) Transcript_24605:427-1077(+)